MNTQYPENLRIGGQVIRPGERQQLTLELPKLYDFTEMKMPVEVIRGKKPGPIMFVSAAIHGDEINGVDIIRRLLRHQQIQNICGTLIAIPIVNVFGFIEKSRYLPDRRDLNRSFPGAENGSQAAQVAYIFRTEIVEKCTHGIDLHTGALHRRNLPQIRVQLDHKENLALAQAFDAPVILNASVRDGSLRDLVLEKDIPVLLYEAATALRFDNESSYIGVNGILNVMHKIGMLPDYSPAKARHKSVISHSSMWVRAPHSGIFLNQQGLGDVVKKDEVLGVITDPFGNHEFPIPSPIHGVIVGTSILPLANEGDALFHIAALNEDELTEDLDVLTDYDYR